MSSFEHSRYLIFNPGQHPLRHVLSDFAYANPVIPGIGDVEAALDYIFNALYPKSVGSFANMAALTAAIPTPTPNDYAFIQDDGDGKGAGYVWQVIEGTGQWYKRYDVDWSMEAILAETQNRTQYMYVHKFGMTDRDAAGVDLTGSLAGQHIYGGDSANQNLTLHANSADLLGSITGFVQTEATLRPLQDATFDLGTAALRWRDLRASRNVIVGTLTLAAGSISDSSGAIAFGSDNLSTTGTLAASQITLGGTLVCSTGNIHDTSGSISFGTTDLTTTGTVTGSAGSVFGDISLGTGSISSAGGTISLGADDLTTTGVIDADSYNATTQVAIAGDLILTSNALATTASNLTIGAGGGTLFVTAALDASSTIDASGAITGPTVNAGNLSLTANTLSSVNSNGNINLAPNGSGVVQVASHLQPSASNTKDLGVSASPWRTLYLGTALSNGTNQITMGETLALRNNLFRDAARTQAVQAGDALFYDATSGTWLASAPDTEITHSTLSGLTTGDAGHTQFVVLAGRAGGQTVQGGTAASQNLTLESTSNASKGSVIFKDTLLPNSDNGIDIGSASKRVKDFYSGGQLIGARAENQTTGSMPTAGASSKGRLVFQTDTNKLMVDTGGAFAAVGASRWISDTSWTGSQSTQTFTVTAGTIADARNALWQFCDNANSYERIYCSIKPISATQVTVTTDLNLPAGTYRLIGIE